MSILKYQTALLHNDCVRMLRRPSKSNIVDDIMYCLFKVEYISDYNNPNNNSNNNINNINNKSLYESILEICGCNIF